MKLKNVQDVEKNKVELEFSIDKEQFDAAVNRVYRKNVSKMNVPGFRKGKAPRSIIEKMYGKGVFYEDAVNDILPEAYEEALKESGKDAVSRPEIDIESIDEECVTIKATIYIKPVVEIKDYKGIAAEKILTEVTDEMVDAEVERVRERNARLVEITDRPAKMGDTVKIDFDGYVEGEQFEGGKGDNYSLKLGSGTFIPGYEEQIVGHNVDDEFDVNVTFPENYGHEALAGKPAVFKVKLHTIQYSQLPDLDDDFAVDVSDFDTLIEYKADLKAKMQQRYENSADGVVEGKLIDALIENMTADIPECMYDNETENIIRERDYSLRSQGLDLATYLKYMNSNLDDMRNQVRPMAERQVKTRLALEKVAELEGLCAEQADLDAEYEKLAAQYSMEVDRVKEAIASESLAEDIKTRKAVDFVKTNAVITVKSAAEAAEEKKAAEEKAEKSTKKTSKTSKASKPAEEGADEASSTEEAAPKKRTRKKAEVKDAE